MDIMKLKDILFNGVPETILAILVILSILNGTIDYKDKLTYFKIALSNVVILSVIFFSRSNLNSIMYISFYSTLIYTLTYKYIFKYNWRQSVFGGVISIFLILLIEILMLPFVSLMLENVDNFSLFENRVVLFLPARFIQISILLLILKFRITLKDNDLIVSSWKKLALDKKIITLFILLSIITCMFFNFNYAEIYTKIHVNEIDSSVIASNLQIFFFGSILMMLTNLVLLFRTFKHEEYRVILRKTPEEFIQQIFANSTHRELRSYMKIFSDELQVARVSQIRKYITYIKESYHNLTFEINDNIIFAEVDYLEIMDYYERLIEYLDKDAIMHFSVAKESENIILELQIKEVSEIQFKSIKNHYKKLSDLKKEIVLNLNAAVSLDYINQVALIDIVVPIQKYYGKEGSHNETKS